MSKNYDAIVIGAGHNGLTCACYLAKKGLRVLVLEQYSSIGGMTNTEEITLPGYKSDTHAICIQFANFSPALAELGLAKWGFEMLHPEISLTHAFDDGASVSIYRDIKQTSESIARFSKKDSIAWQSLYNEFLLQKNSIFNAFNSPPQTLLERVTALSQLPDGYESYRFQLQSLRSFCDEWFVANETKMLFGGWAIHAGLTPDDAGGGGLAWLFSMIVQHFGNNVVKGGMRHLPLALESFLKTHNADIRTNALVKRIIVKHGKAKAVELVNGEIIDCGKLIVSAIHPKTLVHNLLQHELKDTKVYTKMNHYELGESLMVIYVALDSPVQYRVGSCGFRSIYVHPSPASVDYFTTLWSQTKSGLLPQHPFALICNDSGSDSSRVPNGKALMKFVVQPIPNPIKGDACGEITQTSWQEVKEIFADRVINHITKHYIPDLKDKIIKRVVFSPEDIEHKIPSALHGTITYGAFVPYQIEAMRPIPEMGNYRSPIANIYLCGSGSHPGPGVTMAPGRNAAHIIYNDLGI